MSIETFTFRLTQNSIRNLSNSQQADLRYVVVKETRESRYHPGVRVALPEEFTVDEKVSLEKLSLRVNTERRLQGIR